MSKSNGDRLYLVEIKRTYWHVGAQEMWTALTAIRPSSDKEVLHRQMAKYLAKRSDEWRCGDYRIATFKRTRSEAFDKTKLVGKKS